MKYSEGNMSGSLEKKTLNYLSRIEYFIEAGIYWAEEKHSAKCLLAMYEYTTGWSWFFFYLGDSDMACGVAKFVIFTLPFLSLKH
jgi:hypothetical protein